MSGRFFLLVASALAALIFILANLIAQPRLAGARMDFTETGLYSLSDGTRQAMKTLAEPVDITFVYTSRVGQDYPAVRAYAARVRELLGAYEGVAGKRLHIREIDPTPFSEAEDEALAAGITAIDTQGGDPLYFGIIGRNETDDLRVLPFLAPERESTIEYDLTRLIIGLDRPEPATIAILSSLQGLAGNGSEGGYYILQEMAKSFHVRPLSDAFAFIPDDVDVLLIAHPPELSDTQLYAIDQFVMTGGRALILVDPAAKAAVAGGVMNVGDRRPRSDLEKLGSAWGVSLSQEAVADASNALPVEADGGEGRIAVIGQPLFIAAPPFTMSAEDPVTSELSRPINFGAAGALGFTPLEGAQFTPLVITGPAPSYVDPALAVMDMSPSQVVQAYDALSGPLVLAARLTGELPSAFPGGPPVREIPDDLIEADLARLEPGPDGPHLMISGAPANLIWVGDADLVDDGFFINPNGGATIADNAAFILNALENLSGGTELVTLRSRAPGLQANDPCG